ncbi:MAG: hypothetical protein IKJ56_04550, partial [Bacteroidales bacterium]|nr:hypothetical protein [Bacteroidales bacterium]
KNLRALNLGKNKSAVMRVEIADSRLRNAPRSVSRALTGFRDDYEGGLSVFCCHMLFLLSFYSFFYDNYDHWTTFFFQTSEATCCHSLLLFYSFLRASEPRGFRDD